MNSIKPGDRVIAVENGELKKAIVKDIYGNVAIVDFGGGYYNKKRLFDLAPEPVQEIQEEPTQPVKKSEITITPVDFENVCIDVINHIGVFLSDQNAELLGKFSAILSHQMFMGESKND